MSTFWGLAMLPFACAFAFVTGLLFCRALGARTQEQIAPVMALSALAAFGASLVAELGRPLALFAFWSFSHLAALPLVLRHMAPPRD